jgi:hypothetical protein
VKEVVLWCHVRPSCDSEGSRESFICDDDGWKATSSFSSSPATIRKRSTAKKKTHKFAPNGQQQIFLSAVEKWDNDNNREKRQY